MWNLKILDRGYMTGYQDFVKIFGSGVFIKSKDISKKCSLPKALASLYIIPTFFRGIYYIPTPHEHSGHFIEKKQDFFTFLFNFKYGRKNWYWALSTAARYYGIEWSATKVLEIITQNNYKTIDISSKVTSLRKKKSYRSLTLAKYLASLDISSLYIHKGTSSAFSSLKIDGEMGPVCTKSQLRKDVEIFISKVRNKQVKRVYKRILVSSKNWN